MSGLRLCYYSYSSHYGYQSTHTYCGSSTGHYVCYYDRKPWLFQLGTGHYLCDWGGQQNIFCVIEPSCLINNNCIGLHCLKIHITCTHGTLDSEKSQDAMMSSPIRYACLNIQNRATFPREFVML